MATGRAIDSRAGRGRVTKSVRLLVARGAGDGVRPRKAFVVKSTQPSVAPLSVMGLFPGVLLLLM
jgi:hypothetical protein